MAICLTDFLGLATINMYYYYYYYYYYTLLFSMFFRLTGFVTFYSIFILFISIYISYIVMFR